MIQEVEQILFQNADSGVHHSHLYLPFKNGIQLRGCSPATHVFLTQVMVVESRPKALCTPQLGILQREAKGQLALQIWPKWNMIFLLRDL